MNLINKSTFLIPLFLALFVSCSEKLEVTNLLEYQGKYPDESAEQMEIIYTENGEKSFVLYTPLLNKYYEGNEVSVSYMDCPEGIKIVSFDDNGKEQSILTADYAINQELSRRMEARDNVVLVNLNKNETIETELIIWDKNTRKIFSDKEVRYTKSDGSVSYGDGFDADESFSKYSVRNPRGEIIAQEY